MPFKCCVPLCKSNYSAPYVSCFRFPKKDERRKLWLNRIHRDNFQFTENARVCIKHFSEDMIIKEDRWTDKDGKIHIIPRVNPTLTEDAFPCYIHEKSHLNISVPKKRKTRDEKEEELVQESLALSITTYEQEIKDAKLNNITEVEIYLKDYLKFFSDWTYILHDSKLTLLKVCIADIPQVKISLKVSSDLTFEIFSTKEKIDTSTLNIKFKTIKSKNDIDDLLKACDNLNVFSKNIVDDKFTKACKFLEDIIDEFDEDKSKSLKLLTEQIHLIRTPKERYRFSSDLLQFAFKIFLLSPSTYNTIRKTKLLILPHPTNLRKLASKLYICTPDLNVKSNYLQKRLANLKSIERYVNILLDEIHISPELTFKGGKLTGSSLTDSNELAKTAQVFSITSSFGNYKDVIAILPVHKNSGNFLYEITIKILHDLHELGVFPLTIISDNNQINKSLFTYFTIPHPFGHDSFLNPVSSDIPLFLLYDTVHIFKNIRNNWINQKNATLNFPDLNNVNDIKNADFNLLRDIYCKEKENLLKYGHKLCYKALYPSNIERQKVSLVCKIFNYENINALKNISNCETDGTVTFLSIILKWWNIVNVKSLNKNIRFKNDDFTAITSENQEQLKFLNDISDWLKQWEILSKGNLYNGLSSRTFDAFRQTCKGLYGLALFALKELNVKFLLLGKFQTDPLEERFSLYRQLSGSNYYISLQQLIESEKKIRIQNLLNTNDNVKSIFHEIANRCTSEVTLDAIDDVIEIDDLKPINKKIMPIILYIAGYAAFKTSNKIKCISCINVIICNDTLEYEFSEECTLIDALDRGSLKKPTAFTVKAAYLCNQIFEKVLENFHNDFFNQENQLQFLIRVTEPYIRNIINDLDRLTNPCQHDCFNYFNNIVQIIYKILLNNHSKNINEKFIKEKEAKRKTKKFS